MHSLGYNPHMEKQKQLQLNQEAPNFTLLDLNGNTHSLQDYKEQIVILNFWSAECPWSHRSDEKIIRHLPNWEPDVKYLPVASNANENLDLISV